jgi:hypothetical protein
MRTPFRLTSVVVAALAAGLLMPGHAAAATVTTTPTLSWAPWKSCGDTSTENCAQVRAIARTPAGSTFLGGDFTELRSPDGTKKVAVSNLAVLDNTGQPLASFVPKTFNGAVLTLATDGSTVYAGGTFTRIDGKYAARIARFDAVNGGRQGFTSGVNGPVFAAALVGSKLYIGGRFSAVQSLARGNLAALDAGTGKVDPSWTPTAELIANDVSPNDSKHNNTPIRTIAASQDGARVFVGGDMDRINGVDQPVVAALDPAAGALDTSFNPTLSGLDKSYQAMQIAPDDRGGMALATGGKTNRGWRLGPDGSRRWNVNTNGDVQAAAISGGTVYFGGHFTKVCRKSCYDGDSTDDTGRMHIAAFDDLADTRPDPDSTWAPRLGPASSPYFFGVYTLLLDGGDLYVGGVWKQIYSGGKSYPQPKFASFRAL